MSKTGYPDGSIGVVVKIGENYLPGETALFSRNYIKITDVSILKAIFDTDTEIQAETVRPSELATQDLAWNNFKLKYGNTPILKITNNVTLIPRFKNVVLHVITEGDGYISLNGKKHIVTINSFVSGPNIKVGGNIGMTPIEVNPPVYIAVVELGDDNERTLYARTQQSTLESINDTIELPGGVWDIELNIAGSFDYGKTVYAKINSTEIASASYNAGNGTFFNDYHLRVKIDKYAKLEFSASSDIRPEFLIHAQRIPEPDWSKPKLSTYTASETSSTASTTTAFSDVKPHRLRNININVNIASGGGSVKVKADGSVIAEYTTSGTYSLPDLENILKLEFEVAGDGTNASSVTLTAIEETKDLIVVSLL